MLVDEKVRVKIEIWIGGQKYDFSDRLLSVSDITKKLEEQGGSFSSGDLNFELANDDNLFDEEGPLFLYNTWMNRPVLLSLVLLEEGGREVSLFGGYIQYKEEKEDAKVEFKARELTKLWMDRQIEFKKGETQIIYPHYDWVPIYVSENMEIERVRLARNDKGEDDVFGGMVRLIFANDRNPVGVGKIKFDKTDTTLQFTDASGIAGPKFAVVINTNYRLISAPYPFSPESKYLMVRTGATLPTTTLEENVNLFESTMARPEWRSIDNPADIFWDLIVNHGGYKASDDIWQFIDEEVYMSSWYKLEQWSCARVLGSPTEKKDYKLLDLLEELTQPFAIALFTREDGHVHFESYLEGLDKETLYVPYEWLTRDTRNFDVADLFNHVLWTYGGEGDAQKIHSTAVYGQSYAEYRAIRTLEIKSQWLPATVDTNMLDMLAYRIYAKYGRPLARREIELGAGGLEVRLNETLLIKNRLWKILRFRKRPIPFRCILELVPADELGIKLGYVSRSLETHPNEIPTEQNIADAFAQVCYPAYEGDSRSGFPEGKNYWERLGYEVA